MRLEVAAFIALAMAASPAFADSASQSDNANQHPSPAFADSASQSDNAQNPSAPSSNAAPKAKAMQSQAAFKQSLQQAGFKDIQITAESYVVHAKGPDGSPIVMMITPDSVTGVVENPQTASAPDADQKKQ